jgi:hypothetical protein
MIYRVSHSSGVDQAFFHPRQTQRQNNHPLNSTATMGSTNSNPSQTTDLPNFKPTLFERIFVRVFHFVNSYIAWHKLPGLIGAFNLDFMRVELRNYNLHDGYASADAQGKAGEILTSEDRFFGARNSDGQDNSLELRKMGCAGMRFGRNFSREHCKKPTEDELFNPSPRLVSQAFMARRPEEFKPATTLNLLAAACKSEVRNEPMESC